MDSFFGIGAPELFLIMILAGIVMGPQRIRQTALWLGKATAQLQAISRGFMRQINAELDSIDQDGELKSAMAEVSELRRQVSSMRSELTAAALGPVREGKKAVEESQALLQQTIRPPHFTDEPDDEPDDTPDGRSDGSDLQLPKSLDIADDPEA